MRVARIKDDRLNDFVIGSQQLWQDKTNDETFLLIMSEKNKKGMYDVIAFDNERDPCVHQLQMNEEQIRRYWIYATDTLCISN